MSSIDAFSPTRKNDDDRTDERQEHTADGIIPTADHAIIVFRFTFSKRRWRWRGKSVRTPLLIIWSVWMSKFNKTDIGERHHCMDVAQVRFLLDERELRTIVRSLYSSDFCTRTLNRNQFTILRLWVFNNHTHPHPSATEMRFLPFLCLPEPSGPIRRSFSWRVGWQHHLFLDIDKWVRRTKKSLTGTRLVSSTRNARNRQSSFDILVATVGFG